MTLLECRCGAIVEAAGQLAVELLQTATVCAAWLQALGAAEASS